MGAKKISDEVIGLIKYLLEQKWSSFMIKKEVAAKCKDMISESAVNCIRQGTLRVDPASSCKENSGRRSSLNARQLGWLQKEFVKPNPLTQRNMGNHLNISPRQVRRYKSKFGLRTVKKPKGHEISEQSRLKRHRRSWPMYLRLRGGQHEKFITSDEAWFYLTDCNGQTKIQYLTRDQKRSAAEHLTEKHQSKGLMVWAAFSSRGKGTLRFIEPGCKINADYYIREVLEPFIKKDLPRLSPENDCVFQQDSAPTHATKRTVSYLRSKNIAFITPEQWMPNSPDAASCDHSLWSYLNQNYLDAKSPPYSSSKMRFEQSFKRCLKFWSNVLWELGRSDVEQFIMQREKILRNKRSSSFVEFFWLIRICIISFSPYLYMYNGRVQELIVLENSLSKRLELIYDSQSLWEVFFISTQLSQCFSGFGTEIFREKVFLLYQSHSGWSQDMQGQT